MSERKKKPPVWVPAVAGMLSGATTAFFTAPLDLMRTQQMVMHTPETMTQTTRRVLAKEGIVGLYRGLGLTMMGLMPTWAVYWASYSYLKSLQVGAFNLKQDSVLTHLLAAMGAGVATTISTSPIWVVKTRLQTQSLKLNAAHTKYHDVPHAVMTIVKQEGISAFFRGVFPSLLGVSHVCVQFPLYEHLKLVLAERGNKSTQELSFIELICASMISKVVASTAAFPHEVLRVRQQVERDGESSLMQLAKHIYQKDGFRGFYRGLSTNLFRVVPAAAITFVSFEYFVRFFNKVRKRYNNNNGNNNNTKKKDSEPSA